MLLYLIVYLHIKVSFTCIHVHSFMCVVKKHNISQILDCNYNCLTILVIVLIHKTTFVLLHQAMLCLIYYY